MRYIVFVGILLFLSCKSMNEKKPGVQISNDKNKDTVYIKEYCDSLIPAREIDISVHTKLDTVRIMYEYDTLVYSKEEFNQIADLFPELHEDIPENPDIEYFKSGIFKNYIDKDGIKQNISFGSEQGQDIFYMLYAYFLKQKSSFKGADELRNKLIDAAHIIRNLFLSIAGFGTYYTHQFRRIYGYAEYWLYWYGKPGQHETAQGFAEQKRTFLLTLKNEIKDIIANDNDISGKKAKDEKIAELFPEIDQLDKLVTNFFTLRRIQEYRYSYYQ